MTPKGNILNFEQMNDLYRHINVPVWTTNPDLHIYRFSDFTEDTLASLGPHTKNFHQISFIQGFGTSELNINDQKIRTVNGVLYFISPNHIYSWARDKKIDGYILNFKQDYLPVKPSQFQEQFHFFHLDKLNAFPIATEENDRVTEIFSELYAAYYKEGNPFSEQILKHYLQVVLYKCLDLYQERVKTVDKLPENQALFVKYQNLINNYYLSKRSIKEYAELLHVTPNHLSETIKASTGKKALHYINQRLLLEAKNLLKYGEEDVKQIAYILNFASPSHFGKFFKANTQQTPANYRKSAHSEK